MQVRLFVSFPEELVDRPMIYEIVKRFDVVPNIRRANVEAHSGWMILELSGEQDAVRRHRRVPRRSRLHREHHGRRRHRGLSPALVTAVQLSVTRRNNRALRCNRFPSASPLSCPFSERALASA